MKKTYTKPEISFESFLMSTNIASQCEGEPVGLPARGTCGVPGSGGDVLFSASVQGANGCTLDWTLLNGADDYNGFCYHNPTEYNNLFNS